MAEQLYESRSQLTRFISVYAVDPPRGHWRPRAPARAPRPRAHHVSGAVPQARTHTESKTPARRSGRRARRPPAAHTPPRRAPRRHRALARVLGARARRELRRPPAGHAARAQPARAAARVGGRGVPAREALLLAARAPARLVGGASEHRVRSLSRRRRRSSRAAAHAACLVPLARPPARTPPPPARAARPRS